MALMLASEVVARISARNIQTSQFVADDITVAELRYIKTLLGADLYSAVVAGSEPDNEYVEFIDNFIKPALAWFTFYVAADRLMIEVADRGFMQLTADNAQPMGRDQLASFKSSILDNANTFAEAMTDYIADRVADDDPLFVGLYTVNTDKQSAESAVVWTANSKKEYHL